MGVGLEVSVVSGMSPVVDQMGVMVEMVVMFSWLETLL